MVGKHKDLTGQKFFMVTVVERAGNDRFGNAQYKCLCDCGKEFRRISQHIKDPRVKSCGCLRGTGGRRGKVSPNWKGVGDLSSSFVSHIKSHAKYRKIDFDLSVEFLWDLFLKQDRRCALTGAQLIITKQGNAYYNRGTASVDRIDSFKGYIEGNVQWVLKDVNFMKQRFAQQYFIDLCEKVYKYSKNYSEEE